jgi:carboxylesterase
MEENNSKRYNFFLKGSDKAVLLIHGITGTPSEMRYFGKKLNQAGYTVFCNTLPRHCDTLSELRKVTWQEIEKSCIEDLENLKKEHRQVSLCGISMGALLALHLAYKFPQDISAIIALAPTLFYDGWSLHKGTSVMQMTWHIPWIRNMVNIREEWPYGLKDEDLRDSVERFYKNARASQFSKKVFLFGSPFFPMSCLYQHHLLTKVTENELPQIKAPILILHAKDDDMASLKNAEYIYNKVASINKRLVILEDSYHMITIDKEKDKVAQESINFLNLI